MPLEHIVAIGASAGGISALTKLLAALPSDLNAAVFVVQHRSGGDGGWGPDGLAETFDRASNLSVCAAEDLHHFQPGTVYVCPAGHHLLVGNGIVRLELSPKEVHVRPSIDVLFRSAATSYGRRVIGVLLTGCLYDGTSGLWEIKKRGGVTIAQDPREAQFPEMPQTAIDNGFVDYVLSLDSIAKKTTDLISPKAIRDLLAEPIRVLIVEDDALVASNIRSGLQTFGYEVTGVSETGEKAILLAAETNPDLVLMDIGLAGSLTGVEAARFIWDRFQIPIVYLTAYTDVNTLNQVKTTENYGYVVKPVHIEAVKAAVELALSRWDKERRVQFD